MVRSTRLTLSVGVLSGLAAAYTPWPEGTPVVAPQAQWVKPQAPIAVPACQKFDCANAGCGSDFKPTTTVVPGTTILYHTSSPAHPSATCHGSTTVGGNGHTSSVWTVTHPSTLVIPAGTPTAPPCGHWTVTHIPQTIVVGPETVIINNPTVTAVGPGSIQISTTTVTKTVTVHDPTSKPITPILPITSAHPQPSCDSSKPIIPWSKVDIYKGSPWTFHYDDVNPGTLEVVDAGYKTELYSIEVDGVPVGVTYNGAKDSKSDPGAWCGIDIAAKDTCRAQGFMSGSFPIPAGKHTVTVSNVDFFDHSASSYSTIFYHLGRNCASGNVKPPQTCTEEPIKPWKDIDVHHGQEIKIEKFNYNYPTKLSLVDAGYRSDKYMVVVDGIRLGQTHDYANDWSYWCGLTVDRVQDCIAHSYSTGVFVVPPGAHDVGFTVHTTSDPKWGSNSTVFYKIDKYCEQAGSVVPPTHPVTTGPTPPITTGPTPPITTPVHPVTTPVHPACTPGTKTAWTKVDVYKSKPWTFNYDDTDEGILKIQDAGYQTEQYAVDLGSTRLGVTSKAGPDRGAWCGIDLDAQLTCRKQGMSYGEFRIPPGKHSITVTNLKGFYNDVTADYSTLFYTIERSCPGQHIAPATCTVNSIKPYVAIDIHHGQQQHVEKFNYDYPVHVHLVDAGYRADKYMVLIGNSRLGQTHDYVNDWSYWCGLTTDRVQNCMDHQYSTGSFVVPKGAHDVSFYVSTTADLKWGANSTVFYKVEKYCPPPQLPIQPEHPVTTPPVTSHPVTTGPSTPITSHPVTTPVTTPVTKPITTPVTPPPQCHHGTISAWAKHDIYKGKPFTIQYNEHYPGVLKLQDAGYRSEHYEVAVDGHVVGKTSGSSITREVWCGITEVARLTCEAQGLSKGAFNIPAGKHTITVTNIPGVYNDHNSDYSTLFYEVDRVCPGVAVQPPHCSHSSLVSWTPAHINHGSTYSLTLSYNYPVKVTVLDAAFRADRYWMTIDGVRLGGTRDYVNDWNYTCGTAVSGIQSCINHGNSEGEFVVPYPHGSIKIELSTTANPAWGPFSNFFYKVEAYCPVL